MAMLGSKDDKVNAYSFKMSGKQSSSGSEIQVVATHNAILADKLLTLFRNIAKNKGVALPKMKNMESVKNLLLQLLNNSILMNLTYISSAIDISKPQRLLNALALTTLMCNNGFKPPFNEQWKTKIVKWVHYNKPIGNIDNDASKCHIIYEDAGFLDEKIIYAKDLMIYGRFTISSYPATQGDSTVYSFSMNNYDVALDHFWYKVPSKYDRHLPCKYLPGAIFACPMSKPVKFEKDDDYVDHKYKFISSIRKEKSTVNRISKLFSISPEFDLKTYCRYLLGIDEDSSQEIIDKSVDRLFETKFNLIITNLEITDIIDTEIMKKALFVIKGVSSHSTNYRQLIDDAMKIDMEEVENETDEDYSLEALFGTSNLFSTSEKNQKECVAENNDVEINKLNTNEKDISEESSLDDSSDDEEILESNGKRKATSSNESKTKKVKIQDIM